MARVRDLEDVYESVRDDPRWDHLRQPGIVLVKGRGQTDPEECLAMVVGEAPGATENGQRRPFCGPSGKVLKGLMATADLWAEDRWSDGSEEYPETIGEVPANAFITNVVKYRPPGNRTPNAREIMFGAEALRQEWAALGRPKLIVAVGATARSALTPVERRIAPGDWVLLPDGETYVWVHYHPAFGLRRPDMRPTMERQWEEMGAWIRETLT